jgi:hypothetical protein
VSTVARANACQCAGFSRRACERHTRYWSYRQIKTRFLSPNTRTVDGDKKYVGLAHQLPGHGDEETKLKEKASAQDETWWLGQAFQVMSLLHSDGQWVSLIPRCAERSRRGDRAHARLCVFVCRVCLSVV